MKQLQIFLTSAAIVVLLALSGHYLYREQTPDPPGTGWKVRPLNSDLKRSTLSESRTSGISRSSPQRPHPASLNRDTGQPTRPQEPSPNQVPNQEVGRVLLQILAGQKLHDGISISVTDKYIRVAGELDSEEKKHQLLKILDGGREARRIDTRSLVVRE